MTRYSKYTDIPVWILAHKFTLSVYELSSKFPKHELFGITSQLRRATLSVPSNLVEGISRQGKTELKQFLTIARASLMEADYQLLLAKDLKYITLLEYDTISIQSQLVQKQLNAWLKSLRS